MGAGILYIYAISGIQLIVRNNGPLQLFVCNGPLFLRFVFGFKNKCKDEPKDNRCSDSRRGCGQSSGKNSQKSLFRYGLFTPLDKSQPNPVSGTVAPAPAKSTRG